MTHTIRRSDKELQTSVAEELLYNPSIDASHLVVLANDGVVTLSGEMGNLPQRHAARRAAMRVSGVRTLIDDMLVHDPGTSGAKDTDIAEAASQMLRWAVDVPSDAVKVRVSDRTITLSGIVTWQYQREAAARAVSYLRGIVGVNNAILLTATVPTSDVKAAILAAVRRNAQLDLSKITVDVSGGEVTLRGAVRSWAERRQAEYVAWSASAVTSVRNDITVTS
jgi:osmotically-inducible protein OsmY